MNINKLNYEELQKLYKDFVTKYVSSHDVSWHLQSIIKGFLEANFVFFKENNMHFKSEKDLSEFLEAHIQLALAPGCHQALIDYSKNIEPKNNVH